MEDLTQEELSATPPANTSMDQEIIQKQVQALQEGGTPEEVSKVSLGKGLTVEQLQGIQLNLKGRKPAPASRSVDEIKEQAAAKKVKKPNVWPKQTIYQKQIADVQGGMDPEVAAVRHTDRGLTVDQLKGIQANLDFNPLAPEDPPGLDNIIDLENPSQIELDTKATPEQAGPIALMLATVTNNPEFFDKAKEDLEQFGNSPILTDTLNAHVAEKQQAATDAANESLLDAPFQDLDVLVEAYKQEYGDASNVDEDWLENLFAGTVLATGDPEAIENPESIRHTLEGVAQYIRYKKDLKSIKDDFIGGLAGGEVATKTGFVGALIDGLSIAVTPGLEGEQTAASAKAFLEALGFDNERGVINWGLGRLLPGEKVKKVREAFNSVPYEHRAEVAKLLVNAIKRGDGVFENNVMQMFLLEPLLKANPEEGSPDWDRIISNTVGIFDVVLLGGLVRSTVKTAKSAKALKPSDMVRILNPEEYRRWIMSINTDAPEWEKLAKAYGYNGIEDIIHDALPKAMGAQLKAGPDGLLEVDKIMQSQLWEVLDRIQFGNLLNEEAKARVSQKILTTLQEQDGATLHLGKSLLGTRLGQKGEVAMAAYGKTPDSGFQSLSELRERIYEISASLGTDPKSFRILYKKPGVGALNSEGGEFTRIGLDDLPALEKEIEAKQLQLREDMREVFMEKIKFRPIAEKEDLISAFDAGKFDAAVHPSALKDAHLGEEYFIQVPYFHKYSGYDGFWDNGSGPTIMLQGIGKVAGRWLNDVDSFMTANNSGIAHWAEDVSAGVRNDILGVINNQVKGLKPKEAKQLNQLLQEGAERVNPDGTVGKNLTMNDILAIDPNMSDEVITAYVAARNVADALYLINNRSARLEAVRQGYKNVVHGENFQTSAKPLSEAEAALEVKPRETYVYDPSTNTIRLLPERTIKNLYKNGGSIGKMTQPITRDLSTSARALHPAAQGTSRVTRQLEKFEADYILIDKANDTRLAALPEQYLQYIPGYFPRVHTDIWFIRKFSPIMKDGKKIMKQTTVGTATTKKAANAKAAEEASKLPKGSEDVYKATWDRAYEEASSVRSEDNTLSQRGRLYFSGRGNRLQSDLGNGRIENPVTALQKAVGSISRREFTNNYINAERRKFLMEYKDVVDALGDINIDKLSLDEIADRVAKLKGDLSIPNLRLKEAETYLDHLTMIDNMALPTSIAWRSIMAKTARFFFGLEKVPFLGELVGKAALHSMHRTPVDYLKSAAFTMFLVGHPFRQAILQTQQSMFLMGISPKYIAGGGVYKDSVTLRMGLALWGKPKTFNAWIDELVAADKSFNKKEYVEKVNAFKRSGLLANIDSHHFALQTVYDDTLGVGAEAVGDAFKRVAGAIKAPFKLSRDAGFNWGEKNNLTASWLVAHRKAVEKLGRAPSSQKEWDDIGSLARQYALSMNKSGQLKYQKGLFGLATQFLSISQKAWFALLPHRLGGGGKVFSSAERARLLMGQTALFGANAYGMLSLYQNIRDHMLSPDLVARIPPDLNRWIEGGFVDVAFNKGLEAITGEEQDISISEDFAASSGPIVAVREIINNLKHGNIVEVAGGASASAVGRIYQVMRFIKADFEVPDLSTVEQIDRTVVHLSTLLSGMSKLAQGRASLFLGNVVNNSGQTNIPITKQEAWAKMLVGLRTHSEKDLGAMMYNNAARAKMIKEDAKFMDKMAKQKAMLFLRRGDYDATTFLEEYFAMRSSVNTLYSDEEQKMLIKELHHLNGQGFDGQDSLYDMFAKLITRGGLTSIDAARNAIQSSRLSDEDQAQVLELLEEADRAQKHSTPEDMIKYNQTGVLETFKGKE